MANDNKAGVQNSDTIGPYRIREVLGEGGMSTVYLADQVEPVKRTVALKMIKLGMDTKQIVARFEAERQALAVLEHPSIAKVYDAGSSETGRPYFVMERVHGVPITTFCDQERLSIKARLELIINLCGAVQHAHQKGLIHRDLKPSNILVGRQDGAIVAKVIDFGIAKAVNVVPADELVETKIGQILGTPQYMSPEQAALASTDIDTRTDIYSLGVVLYELLTGVVPLDLYAANAMTIGQMLREKEPVRPSQRVSMDDLDLRWIADVRASDPLSLKKTLYGDLDWITMKALSKERERRYVTVAELAEDLKNYLAHRPVIARPPSRAYVLSRFVRRNRLVVIATAASIAALVVGVTAASIGFVRASSAEQVARTEAQRAEQRTQQAESLLGFMVGDLRSSLEPLGRLDLMEDIGAEAMAYFSKVDLSTLTDQEILRQAQVMTQLGEIRLKQLHYDEAVSSFTEAYNRSAVLAENDPSDGDRLFNRGQAEFWIGYSHWLRGSLDEAQSWFEHYRDTSLQLSALDAARPDWLQEVAYASNTLATLAEERGQFDAAEQTFRYALETFERVQNVSDTPENRNNISDTISRLGNVARARGDLLRALEYYRRSEELTRSVWQEDKANAPLQQEVVFALLRLADANSMVGNLSVAIEQTDDSLALSQELIGRDPSNSDLLLDVVKARRIKGFALLALGDPASAAQVADLLVADLEKLLRDASDDIDLQESYADANVLKAWIASASGDADAALKSCRLADEVMSGLLEGGRLNEQAVRTLANAYLTQAELYAFRNEASRASELLRETEDLLKDRVGESSSPFLLEPWARLLSLLGREQEAEPVRQKLESGGFRPLRAWPKRAN
jgi:serine/threonine protein kinase/tetratricopeptide (TPR) repeat protein